MSGNSWNAGKFSLSLRLSPWSEHLGLRCDEGHGSPVIGVGWNYGENLLDSSD